MVDNPPATNRPKLTKLTPCTQLPLSKNVMIHPSRAQILGDHCRVGRASSRNPVGVRLRIRPEIDTRQYSTIAATQFQRYCLGVNRCTVLLTAFAVLLQTAIGVGSPVVHLCGEHGHSVHEVLRSLGELGIVAEDSSHCHRHGHCEHGESGHTDRTKAPSYPERPDHEDDGHSDHCCCIEVQINRVDGTLIDLLKAQQFSVQRLCINGFLTDAASADALHLRGPPQFDAQTALSMQRLCMALSVQLLI